jgi:hypothetical protein
MKPMRHRQNLLQAEELKGPGGRLPVTGTGDRPDSRA